MSSGGCRGLTGLEWSSRSLYWQVRVDPNATRQLPHCRKPQRLESSTESPKEFSLFQNHFAVRFSRASDVVESRSTASCWCAVRCPVRYSYRTRTSSAARISSSAGAGPWSGIDASSIRRLTRCLLVPHAYRTILPLCCADAAPVLRPGSAPPGSAPVSAKLCPETPSPSPLRHERYDRESSPMNVCDDTIALPGMY